MKRFLSLLIETTYNVYSKTEYTFYRNNQKITLNTKIKE